MLKRVNELWGLPKTYDRFPGCQPISIERRHFPILKKNDYVICDKSDGERFLCLIDNIDNVNTCCLIDRKCEITHIKIRPPKECFKGTILDGEIVMENGKKVYLVFDVVAWAGKNVTRLDLPTRFKYIMDTHRRFIRSAGDGIRIRPKVFSHLKDAPGFKSQFVPTLKYNTDGYIITPIFDHVQTGTHQNMFKWKPYDDITIDFLVKKTAWEGKEAEVWDMFIQEKGELVFETHLSRKGLPKKWEKILQKGPAILECSWVNETWCPVRHRTDKTLPNGRYCFYRTLTNINENIQDDEILNIKRTG